MFAILFVIVSLLIRRVYMLENPDNLDEEKIITVKKQIMFAIQIAYGLVGPLPLL